MSPPLRTAAARPLAAPWLTPPAVVAFPCTVCQDRRDLVKNKTRQVVTDGENIRRAQWLLCALSKVRRHRPLPTPPAREG